MKMTLKNTKKMIFGAAVCGTILAGGMTKAFADDPAPVPAFTKNSDGNVAFTTPAENALILKDVANLEFGTHEISANDETYKSETDTTSVVQDIRGTSAGWVLQVAETAQFKAGKTELTGAVIKLDTPTLDESSTAKATPKTGVTLSADGTASTIMTAAQGEGNGLAVEKFATNAASLSVPGATVKNAAGYKTTLVWNLLDTPENA